MSRGSRSEGRGRAPVSSPLVPVSSALSPCFELTDHSLHSVNAASLFPSIKDRFPQKTQARLTEQLVRQNHTLLEKLAVKAQCTFDGDRVFLRLESGSAVGAVPLISPLSGRFDFGMVIQPRFPWTGLGPMLGQMGWRVVPRPLRLPLLRRSERRVPPWVIALMVLERLESLSRQLHRRFELATGVLPAPKGTVLWREYALHHAAVGRFHEVPCRFPDLRDDRILKGMMRWTLETQIASLATQAHHGAFVHQLIERARTILGEVQDAAPIRPNAALTQAMARLPLRNEVMREGLEAIEWTVEERGLAGLCDLEGLPWVMDMDAFFEAWLECVLERVVRLTGGTLRRGRLRQTVLPVRGERPAQRTQLSLIPDFVLESPGLTLIADAKYKRHLEELASGGWSEAAEEVRESHRQDLFQALAYAGLFASPRLTALLAYPCKSETWESLRRRRQPIQKAAVGAAGRCVDLWLVAVPMVARVEDAAEPLIEAIREVRHQAA